MTGATPFFTSKWVERPEHVTELPGGLPQGFRAAGVAAGVKPSGAPDVALLASSVPETASAARFTNSGVLGAPVLLTLERTSLDSIRAVVVNSGNANVATGRRGIDDAAKMQGAAAIASSVGDERHVAVASTGVIGVPLPIDNIISGIAAAGRELGQDGDKPFAEAIQTTDAFEKRASLKVTLPEGDVTLSAQAKGAGMIQPGFATLLVFVQTDALLSAETADLLLGVTTKRSFNRISVDGQLSTSDTVILQANGASGVAVDPQTDAELRFGEALDALMRQLALLVIRDGEGARRTGRVIVRGGEQGLAERVARAIANSPLVKTALYGGDPNWGRIAQAAGMATAGLAPVPLDIAIEGIQVCQYGALTPHDPDQLNQAVQQHEVQYEIGLPGAGAETEVFFSDLGHEYVTINADYTT
jgi:glutamate N-acetyltransferase/amino-acid N-acetyltransferase